VSAMELRRLSIHGQELAVRTAGAGPVILLLHGMASSSDTWQAVMPTLARGFSVVAPDLLGHGASAKPVGEYSLGTHANVVRDLLALLGHDRATLVGHSFGGGVAMQLAYQFPARCERLVLVGSGGLGQEVNGLLRTLSLPGAEQIFPIFCSATLRDAGERLAAWLGRRGVRAAPAVEEIWRSYASLADRDGRRAFFRTLRAVVDHDGQAVGASDRLYLAAHVPTLIVWGKHDTIIPVHHAIAAHEAMPGSRLEIFDEAGHFPHCESPERFADTLVDFLGSTDAARRSEQSWHEMLRQAPNGEVAAEDDTGGHMSPFRSIAVQSTIQQKEGPS
jgi:pimeloyl-ACP methyl ester carboxylesterase